MNGEQGRSAAANDLRMVVSGQGILADAVMRALDGVATIGHDLTDTDTGPSALRIDVVDSWNAHAGPARPGPSRRVLPVRTEIGRVVIGPLTVPGRPGCPTCVHLRRRRAHEHPDRWDALWAQHGDELAGRASGWITGLGASTVAALVADECRCLLGPRNACRTESAILIVDLLAFSVTRHPFVADPMCPDCGQLPDDSPDLAEITLEPRPKRAPGRYRINDLAERADELMDAYVDAECGVVSSIVSGTYGGVPVSIAALRCRQHDAAEPGFGRSLDFSHSQLTAVLEALERFAGAEPGGRRTTVVASYDEVAGHAVSPASFGLHEPESYELPGFAFQPFDPSRPTRWVWGYSLTHAQPVLVPEGAAFWHTHPERDQRPFFFEISNGCALGGCLEEAILYGILEVIERDAFLMTWYSRMSIPRIDLSEASSEKVRLLSSVISSDTGYEVLAFDTTMEHGVPSVWAMAVHPADDYATPKMVCAAGAHLDPEDALVSALSELGPALGKLRETFPGDAARARELLADSSSVTTMDDHATLYGAHEAFSRLDFLTGSTARRSLAEMTGSVAFEWRHEDLTDDLRKLVGRLASYGMDVIAVNQTIPEHRRTGLSCVKVLVPGALSMTFGHQHRRTRGLPRLQQVPGILARRSGIVRASAQVNPYPHPFP